MPFNKYIPVRYPPLFRNALKRIKNSEKSVYITFDDGPNDGTTQKILKLLSDYNAKATFFCVGKNALKYPELIRGIKDNGHSIGNHSLSHKNSFKVSNKEWMEDVLSDSPVSNAKFFRPPYGKISFKQYKELTKIYTIVFWDVLSMDFRENYTTEKIIKTVKRYSRNGSIIVFHDSLKYCKKMLPALEESLKYFSEKGFRLKEL